MDIFLDTLRLTIKDLEARGYRPAFVKMSQETWSSIGHDTREVFGLKVTIEPFFKFGVMRVMVEFGQGG